MTDAVSSGERARHAETPVVCTVPVLGLVVYVHGQADPTEAVYAVAQKGFTNQCSTLCTQKADRAQ